MNSHESKLPLSYRWPVLFWFGVLFCFFGFPIFLVHLGLESILTTRLHLQKQQVYRDLSRKTEQLLHYRNSRHYYHALLRKIFRVAESTADPIAYLEKALPHVKKRNPGYFRFIVWDEKGDTIASLTDEKGYRYIVKTLFNAFSEVSRDSEENYPGTPAELPIIERRINLLKSYLGDFLIPEKMNLPLLRANLGEVILASPDNERAHFWFQKGKKFSMMANISFDAANSTDYLKKLVAGMNKMSKSGIQCGIAELLDGSGIFLGADNPDIEELTVEINKFINFSSSELESDNYLISVKLLNPFVLAFSFCPKKGTLPDLKRYKWRAFVLIAIVIVCLSAIFLYNILIKKQIISIRFKLALLFIYANGLPLIILGFIGYEYLQQNRRLLLSQAQEQVASLISDFDLRYLQINKDYADYLNAAIDRINEKKGASSFSEEYMSEYLDRIYQTRPYDFVLGDDTGRLKYFVQPKHKSGMFFSNMTKNLVQYLNIATYTPQRLFRTDREVDGSKGKIDAKTFLGANTIVFHKFLTSLGKISPEHMGTVGRQYYWNMLGDIPGRKITDIVVISWEHNVMQGAYVEQYLKQLDDNFGNFRFYAIVEDNGITFPEGADISPDVFNFFRQTLSLKSAFADEIQVNSESYAAYGTIGKSLDRMAIVGLIPLNGINSKINAIKNRLLLFAFVSLSLTLAIGRLLTIQFMRPVRELEQGVAAIGRQDFRHRLPLQNADEFGELTTVFNSALESLQELEIAQIVQENLFPQGSLKINNLEVLGKSVSMTRLGGDYYDFFPVGDNSAGILMGDVAGHGIPAALLMAMAKGSVLLSQEEKKDPALMLASLHKVIHRVKSSKIKRMMTCQYFAIDTISGEYLVANAGHCFPALIKDNGKNVELIKLIGTPLGITKKPRYTNTSFKLNNGDIFLLYTDGIIEAQNPQGIELGFENFARILSESYSENLSVYYEGIFSAYKKWSPAADDDITMVLFRFENGEVT